MCSRNLDDAATLLQAGPVRVDTLRCDERYVARVECAGRRFLFSRRDVALVGDSWETWVRAWVRPLTGQGHPSPLFGAGRIGLDALLNMSHNAAFECAGNRTLHVFGGQGYLNSTTQRGIQRRTVRRLHDIPMIYL